MAAVVPCTKGHCTGRPISAEQPQEFAGRWNSQPDAHAPIDREEAAVEVAIDVTATTVQPGLPITCCTGSPTASIKSGWLAIAAAARARLISMGAGHHQNATAGHRHQRTGAD